MARCLQKVNIWGYPITFHHEADVNNPPDDKESHIHHSKPELEACPQHWCIEDEFLEWAEECQNAAKR